MSKTIELDIPKDAKDRHYRRLASEVAKDSIVTDALARLIEQIVREIHEDTIGPLRAELAAAYARVGDIRLETLEACAKGIEESYAKARAAEADLAIARELLKEARNKMAGAVERDDVALNDRIDAALRELKGNGDGK